MYQKEKTDENINMKQKAKSVILKVILKWLNLKSIKEEEKVNVNLKRDSNLY